MLPYADIEFYRTVFKGAFDGTNEQLERLLIQASFDINRLTFNRIVDFERLTDFQRDGVKWACCYQADYISRTGGESNSVASYSVNGVSVSYDKSEKTIADKLNFDLRGYYTLMQTGLMWQGVR